MSKKKIQHKSLAQDTKDYIEDAITNLEDLGWVFSEAEVAADNLAAELREAFFEPSEPSFAGKTPSLYDVVSLISRRYGLGEVAVDAANDLREKLEDSYTEEEDDDVMDEIREVAEVLIIELRKFIESCPDYDDEE